VLDSALTLEWLNYLDGKSVKAPNKIKNFSLQTQTMPSYSFLKVSLGTCSNIKTAIDPSEKFRQKRNRIAHKAEDFKSEKYYMNYKDAIDKAIKQLLTKLSQKANIASK